MDGCGILYPEPEKPYSHETQGNGRTIGFLPFTIMRRETFGGIVFNRHSGTSLEVNRSGFDLLLLIDGTRSIEQVIDSYIAATDNPDTELPVTLSSFVQFLRFWRILEYSGHAAQSVGRAPLLDTPLTPNTASISDRKQSAPSSPSTRTGPGAGKLVAPEVLHLSMTDRCNLNCQCCYLPSMNRAELDMDRICGVLNQCKELGVLQMAIGGGEPLLKMKELLETIRIASRFMRVSVTTNGHLLDRESCLGLREAGLHHLQVSLNGPQGVHIEVTGVRDHHARMAGIATAIESGLFTGVNCLFTGVNCLFTGVNCLFTPSLLPVLPDFVNEMEQLGIRNLNLIRPKRTSANRDWYKEHALTMNHLQTIQADLSRIMRENSRISFTHDCSLVQMYRYENPGKLRSMGIHGCTAGTRICHVASNMDVYGCSHQIGETVPNGNLRDLSLLDIWNGIEARSFPNAPCQECAINRVCIPCVHTPSEEVTFCES